MGIVYISGLESHLPLHKTTQIMDLTEGPVSRHLLRLALPMIIAFIFVTSYNFIDRLFVSALGDIAIAAVGMAFTLQMVIYSIGSGIGAGINSFISRNLGAGKTDQATNSAMNGLLMAVLIGLSMIVIIIPSQRFIFGLMGAEGELLQNILDYLTVILWFSPVILLTMFAGSIFQGYGDTMSPMRFSLLGTSLNLLLDPLLIFGFGRVPDGVPMAFLFNLIPDPAALFGASFPAMGIAGAAFATGISQAIALLYILWKMLLKHQPVRLPFRRLRFDLEIILGINKVGLPSSAGQVMTSLSRALVFWVLAPFGPDALAAYTIIFTFDMVVFLPAIGISQAVTTLTGHNYGAGKPLRVKQTYRAGVGIAFAMMGSLALLILARPAASVGLFTDSPAVLSLGTTGLLYSALGMISLAAYLPAVSSFQGLGLGNQYFIASILRLFVFMFPMVYFGARWLGFEGVWLGLMGMNVLSAIVLFLWHRYILNSKIITGRQDPLGQSS